MADEAKSERAQADEFKQQGNEAFAAKKYAEAEEIYSQGIAIDGSHHVLFANRSATRLLRKNVDGALEDARKSIELSPTWVKGYHRLATALLEQNDKDAALEAYAEALRKEPNNAYMKRQHETIRRQLVAEDQQGPIKSSERLRQAFSRITDVRLRMATLARLWNRSKRTQRLLIFRRFLKIVSGSDVVGAMYRGTHMKRLPMENYGDVVVPTPWLLYYAGLPADDKVELFNTLYNECSAVEKDMVIKDLKFFFSPQALANDAVASSAAGAAAAAAGVPPPPYAPTAEDGSAPPPPQPKAAPAEAVSTPNVAEPAPKEATEEDGESAAAVTEPLADQ